MCLTSQQNVSIVVERIFFLNCTYILPNTIIDHLDAKHKRSYSLISLWEAKKSLNLCQRWWAKNILQKVTLVTHMVLKYRSNILNVWKLTFVSLCWIIYIRTWGREIRTFCMMAPLDFVGAGTILCTRTCKMPEFY